jgi:hypothetical protein
MADVAHVSSAGEAARATGMSPATIRAYTGLQIDGATGTPLDAQPIAEADREIVGLVIMPDPSNPPIKPVEADSGGYPHFLEDRRDLGAGHTAVRTEGPSAGYLLNDVREYVIVGGDQPRRGDFVFHIRDGDWVVERVF